MEKYPYFINPDIDALPSATGEERERLIRRIAACVGDEAALRAITGIDPAEFARFYPDMTPPELSTEDTISSFISRFSSEKAADTPEVEELVAAPAVDYATLIDDDPAESADTPADATSDLISSFLQAVPPKRPSQSRRPAARQEPAAAEKTEQTGLTEQTEQTEQTGQTEQTSLSDTGHPHAEDSALSEALFRLMVKNKNYRKALEIITELSLNNPKKSIYFAYQIRFLKKLIKNQENGG
ncbi:MAG: hypothetical protein K2L59_02685 [Muribaculaceae bacterium]|nr:hypothetical protein [Muribaculaceae bacterium]